MARMDEKPSAEKHTFWVLFIRYETFCKICGAFRTPDSDRTIPDPRARLLSGIAPEFAPSS